MVLKTSREEVPTGVSERLSVTPAQAGLPVRGPEVNGQPRAKKDSAATSHRFITGSSIASARPLATMR